MELSEGSIIEPFFLLCSYSAFGMKGCMVNRVTDDCLGIEWEPPGGRAGPLTLRPIYGHTHALCVGCDVEQDPGLIALRDPVENTGNFTLRYWDEDVTLPDYEVRAPLGAPAEISDFVKYCCYLLDLIYMSPMGKQLLDGLRTSCALQGRRVLITPSMVGSNQYMIDGQGTCRVSTAIRSNVRIIPDELKSTLQVAQPNLDPRARLTWLFQQVTAAPLASNFGFVGLTAVIPSENVPTEDVQEMRAEQACVRHEMAQLTETRFLGWLVNRTPESLSWCTDLAASRALDEHLKKSIIITLYAHSLAGAGAHVKVDVMFGVWRPDEDRAACKRAMLLERPPAVGMAHELIHAHYAVNGLQPDRSDTDVVLTEMACVGLGPWQGAAGCTDNGLRDEWMQAGMLRTAQGLATDPFNIRPHPLQRPYYAWSESDYLQQESRRNPRFRPLAWLGSESRGLQCSKCHTTHGSIPSSFDGRWHRCARCRKLYCWSCGSWLWRSSWGFSRTRQCSCGGETRLIE